MRYQRAGDVVSAGLGNAVSTDGGIDMNRFEYIVADIDGDYAHLRRTDVKDEELKLVARALLPPEIREGTRLLYEWMSYSIME